ncbi:MAG: membrane dipeptidase [Gemmatimonadaceae bacterium]|nr:membrane dipeptidase [Gemmatimonadaceae bacterium]
MTRRQFSKLAAAAALTPALPTLPAPSPPHTVTGMRTGMRTSAWPDYDQAFVLDMLATPGPFNVPDWLDQPLTPAMIVNARRSGITAVNSTVSALGDATISFEKTVANFAAWDFEFQRTPEAFRRILGVDDIRRAKNERQVGIILGFQDTTPIWDKPERVELFYRLGLRVVQLTYNGANLVGDGCLVPEDRGLKPYGRELVARLNERGILVDVSHCGWETSRQAVDASRVPIAATHSGAAALVNVPRNKPDALLRLIAEKGGVIGIYMMPFLRVEGQPTADDFVRHVTHCINVCGEDHVGVGSDNSISPLELSAEFRRTHADFVEARRKAGISAPGEDANIFNYVPDFNTPRRMEQVADALARAGHSTARVEKVLGANWMRVLGEVWGA